jgi:hypothetical protein
MRKEEKRVGSDGKSNADEQWRISNTMSFSHR